MHSDTSPWYSQALVISAASVLVLLLDFLAAPLISFPIAFILPLSILAWWYPLRVAIVLGIAMMIVRTANRILWGVTIPHLMLHELTDNVVYLVVVIIIICLIAQVAQRRPLLQKLASLPEILPICAYCKKIRGEDSQWEEIESYITRQTESTFSHGICPACIETYMEDFRRTKRQS